jgi:hypothetical protein
MAMWKYVLDEFHELLLITLMVASLSALSLGIALAVVVMGESQREQFDVQTGSRLLDR